MQVTQLFEVRKAHCDGRLWVRSGRCRGEKTNSPSVISDILTECYPPFQVLHSIAPFWNIGKKKRHQPFRFRPFQTIRPKLRTARICSKTQHWAWRMMGTPKNNTADSVSHEWSSTDVHIRHHIATLVATSFRPQDLSPHLQSPHFHLFLPFPSTFLLPRFFSFANLDTSLYEFFHWLQDGFFLRIFHNTHVMLTFTSLFLRHIAFCLPFHFPPLSLGFASLNC